MATPFESRVFLLDLLSRPTAPFREAQVMELLTETLAQAQVPHFFDPIGNLVVGASSKKDLLKKIAQKTPEHLRIYIAHTDHPGFHGAKALSPKRLGIRWHGGSPIAHLEGAPVWFGLNDKSPEVFSGKLTKASVEESSPKRFAIKEAELETDDPTIDFTKVPAQRVYGGFSFRSPAWIDGDRIYTKAADDLAGVYSIVRTAVTIWSKKTSQQSNFIGILTRAEEVGFIGTIGFLKQGWLKGLKRPVIFVSLEASKALPGAEIGKGPVLRLGDRATVFHSGLLRAFTEIAEETLPGKHQRKLMDGGTCEATPVTAFGFPTVGVSVPLGNYHNQSFEGGPDSRGPDGPAPEFVNTDDLEGMVILCQAILKRDARWQNPWVVYRRKLEEMYRQYRPYLVKK